MMLDSNHCEPQSALRYAEDRLLIILITAKGAKFAKPPLP